MPSPHHTFPSPTNMIMATITALGSDYSSQVCPHVHSHMHSPTPTAACTAHTCQCPHLYEQQDGMDDKNGSTHSQVCPHSLTGMPALTHTDPHSCTCTPTSTHIHTCTHTCMHTPSMLNKTMTTTTTQQWLTHRYAPISHIRTHPHLTHFNSHTDNCVSTPGRQGGGQPCVHTSMTMTRALACPRQHVDDEDTHVSTPAR